MLCMCVEFTVPQVIGRHWTPSFIILRLCEGEQTETRSRNNKVIKILIQAAAARLLAFRLVTDMPSPSSSHWSLVPSSGPRLGNVQCSNCPHIPTALVTRWAISAPPRPIRKLQFYIIKIHCNNGNLVLIIISSLEEDWEVWLWEWFRGIPNK